MKPQFIEMSYIANISKNDPDVELRGSVSKKTFYIQSSTKTVNPLKEDFSLRFFTQMGSKRKISLLKGLPFLCYFVCKQTLDVIYDEMKRGNIDFISYFFNNSTMYGKDFELSEPIYYVNLKIQ